IFSALFISYIQVGGDALQPYFIKENIDIIIASIIYLSAFALLMKELISKLILRKSTNNANDDAASELSPQPASLPLNEPVDRASQTKEAE
ncbi:MAG: ABC transporter permease, partial [Clostridia bacterium]